MIERTIVIDRPIADVYDYVADTRNDTVWCPKVRSGEQIDGVESARGASKGAPRLRHEDAAAAQVA